MPFLKLESPPTWLVQESAWEPGRNETWESLCTLANGYMGIRGSPEEPFNAGSSRPGIYLAGLYDAGTDGVSELANVTNILAVEILLDGRPFCMAPGMVTQYARVLSLKRGLLQRSLVYTDSGRTTRLEFERFVSLSNPHVVGQSITLTPIDWLGEVTVRMWLDARADAQAHRRLKLVHAAHMGRDRLLLATQTESSLVRVAHACRCSSWVHEGPPVKPGLIGAGDRIGFQFTVTLEQEQKAVFERLISTYTSRDPDTDSVERGCLDAVRGTEGGAYGVRRRVHVQAWQRRWERANIEIAGPEEDQRSVRFAVFQLLQHAPLHDMAVSIAAGGLSGDSHRGHIFWTTEIGLAPFLAVTNPLADRQILRYRTATLDGAKRQAQARGYQGAMFAWESADTGAEIDLATIADPRNGSSERVPAGELRPYVNAAIAYAAWQYFLASGDTFFRERELLTLAVATGRFWASRVAANSERNGHDIRKVMGPDENATPVNNNAFTNVMAAWNLRLAVQEVERMRGTHRRSRLLGQFGVTKEETLRWTAIADSLYRPVPSPAGVWEQHEGYFDSSNADPRPSQACDQADIMLLKPAARAA